MKKHVIGTSLVKVCNFRNKKYFGLFGTMEGYRKSYISIDAQEVRIFAAWEKIIPNDVIAKGNEYFTPGKEGMDYRTYKFPKPLNQYVYELALAAFGNVTYVPGSSGKTWVELNTTPDNKVLVEFKGKTIELQWLSSRNYGCDEQTWFIKAYENNATTLASIEASEFLAKFLTTKLESAGFKPKWGLN